MACNDQDERIRCSRTLRRGRASRAAKCECGCRSSLKKKKTPNTQRPTSKSERIALLLLLLLLLLIRSLQRLRRLRLFDFLAAFLAGATRVIIPEIEHRLAEMLNDVRAIEVDVFHQCTAIFAVENNVFFFSGRAAPLDHDTDRVRRPLRRVRNIWRDEEGFAFSDDMVHDAVAFADAHLNVALQLIEVLLRIDEMKIVPRVRPLDDHHKKIPSIIKITIAYWRLKFVGVLFDPFFQVNGRLHSRHAKSVFGAARSVKPRR